MHAQHWLCWAQNRKRERRPALNVCHSICVLHSRYNSLSLCFAHIKCRQLCAFVFVLHAHVHSSNRFGSSFYFFSFAPCVFHSIVACMAWFFFLLFISFVTRWLCVYITAPWCIARREANVCGFPCMCHI